MKIAILATCLGDALFPRAPQATVELLERLGHEVVFPADQTCCGQAHVNTGYLDLALPLVRHHVEVFSGAADVVVAPSGSCVGCVRHQHAMVARRGGTRSWRRRPRTSPTGPTSSPSCSSTSSGSPTSAPTTRTA